MKDKCAIFCSKGIGDGLLFCTLAHNLVKNGYLVEVFHNELGQLQDLFPHFSILKYPEKEQAASLLEGYDHLFINADTSEINQHIRKIAKNNHPQKTKEFWPSSSKKVVGDFAFNKEKSVVDNLLDFCKNHLKLKRLEKSNGIKPLKDLCFRKHKNRIIIHPESSKLQNNWPAKKFVKLALHLKKQQFEPVFIVSKQERPRWEKMKMPFIKMPIFSTLQDVASYVYESGYFIGNDSGIGHLASSLKIPTLCIFSSRRKQFLWSPGFTLTFGVCPWPFLPHIKGFRFRDKYGVKLIEIFRVKKRFLQLMQTYENTYE